MKKIFFTVFIFFLFVPLGATVESAVDYSFKVYSTANAYPTVSNATVSYIKDTNTLTVSAKIEDVSGFWAKVTFRDSLGNQVRDSSGNIVTLNMSFSGNNSYTATADKNMIWPIGTYKVDIYVHDWLINDHWYQNVASFSVYRGEKAITAFNFNGLSPAVTGTITESTHAIALTVPYATNVTALVPTITVSGGATVSPASGVARNFTTPQTYTVTAEDNTTQTYIVTVTVISLTPTEISLSVTPQTLKYKEKYSLSAVLKNSNTGEALPNKTISFYLNNDYIKIADATTGTAGQPAVINNLVAGYPNSYNIIAKYAGDNANYLASSVTKPLLATMPTTLNLSISQTSAKPGDTITLTGNLIPMDLYTPDQPIEFYDGANKIATKQTGPTGAAAVVQYTIPSNATIGSHTFSAKYNGGVIFSNIMGYNVTYAPSTSNTQSLTVYNPIIVTASASANPTFVNPTSTITFSSSASGGTGTYSYNWTGDCTGTSATCIRTVSTAKSYTATVTVTSGGQVSKSATVTVKPRLLVSATASPTSVVIGQPVTFSAVVSDTTGTYNWVLSNGASCSNGNTSQICTASFSAIGSSYNATVTETLGDQIVSATSPDVTVVWTCGNNIIDNRDGKSYKTVLIGSQCWMAENLNVGTFSTLANQGTSCSSIQKYCYSDTESNCNTNFGTYGTTGAYYQWNQAMCGSTIAGTQGICPSGWHIPTHSEITILERAVCALSGSTTCNSTFPDNTSTTGWRGSSSQAVGTNLKPLGSTGFNDLLIGYRNKNAGSFSNMFSYGYLWSSTQSGSSAWYRRVGDGYSSVYRNKVSKNYALPIRCVKD